MKINTISHHYMLTLMGSDATDAEAEHMLQLLKASKFQDTDEISDDTWRSMIIKANILAEGDK